MRPEISVIPFENPLHAKIIGAYKHRKKQAQNEHQRQREKAWRESEDMFTAYVKPAEDDKRMAENRHRGTPDYTTISIPYSYAMLMTAHTYYTSIFLSRDPVFQVKGRHGEAQMAETAMESLLDYQISIGENLPTLAVWLMDVGKYGQGIIGQYWDKEVTSVTRYVEQPKTFMGMELPGQFEEVEIVEEVMGYEGLKLYNVRPKDFLTDPHVTLDKFQNGEFVIVQSKQGWVSLKEQEKEKYYNLKYLDDKGGWDSNRDSSGEGHFANLPGQDVPHFALEESHPSSVDVDEFYWTIVPSQWGLGKNKHHEKWVFTIAKGKVIISAQPLGLYHGRYPFDVLTQEIEGYNVYNRSMLEILRPLNETLDWLFNSHFYNVRATLNNQFLVDPSRVHVRDMEEGKPGMLVRLKPAAYGQDVRQFMSQFPVSDVTRGNLSDSDIVNSLAQRVTGVSDNIMGSVNSGGRKTATEIRSSTTFGINRLKTNCEWFSMTGFSALSSKMVQCTQQLYGADKKFRIVGDQAKWLGQYIQVDPGVIMGQFDFVGVDGTLPIDRFAQVNLWQQLLTNLAGVPGMLQQYDMAKIFAFVAQLGGLKNIEQFKIEIQPDEVVRQQAAQGNAVPLRSNEMEPGQIPGMGPTG
jgi:hypothetical protein